MSVNLIDQFYLDLPEATKSCTLYLRDYFKTNYPNFTEEYKWGLPYFYLDGKPFCYLWKDKNNNHPYLGFAKSHLVEHEYLELGNRKRFKVYHINPNKDIDISTLEEIIQLLLPFYT